MTLRNQEVSQTTAILSAYIAGAIRKPLPRDVAARARLHLVDTFAAMISGSLLPPARQGIAYVKSLGGKPAARFTTRRWRSKAASRIP